MAYDLSQLDLSLDNPLFAEQVANVKHGYIYMHTSPSGKSYIGQTYAAKPEYRWNNGEGYKECTLFWRAIQKYGWNNFTHTILEELDFEDIDELNKLEEYYIIKYNTLAPAGYNLIVKGVNHIFSEETVRRMSNAHTGKRLSLEHIRKIKEGNMGFRHTQETKNKLSLLAKQRTHTEETKKKLSELSKNISEETRAKISAAGLGRRHTDESKKKMSDKVKQSYANSPQRRAAISESNRRRWQDPEYRAKMQKASRERHLSEDARKKMSDAKKGKSLSIEHRQKLSISQRARRSREKENR
ncbi:MAG: NUMOD3 domain-containing DNA-binding protein [Acetobacter sp.]|nr:NUMOD3 domain-containing DNA-binding protein [Acetobacter sp.]